MTSASAGDPAGAEEDRGSAQSARDRALPFAAAVLFLALVLPILAVRLHFYLETPRYSHCVLLPVVAALWIWDRSDRLAAVPRGPSWRGFVCLTAGALAFVYGRMVPNNMAQHLAMLLTLAGTLWAVMGAAMLRALAFPLGYLLLMVPLKPWDEAVIQPLQQSHIISSISYIRIQRIGHHITTFAACSSFHICGSNGSSISSASYPKGAVILLSGQKAIRKCIVCAYPV